MEFIPVLVIAVIIFALTYLSSKGNTTKAAIFAALAAAITFVGPYLINLVDSDKSDTSPKQENTSSAENTQERSDFVDTSVDSGMQDLPDDKKEFDQAAPTEAPMSDTELHIEKIPTISTEIPPIESNVVETTDAKITVCEGVITTKDEEIPYPFTPAITGRYRFEISGLTEGTDHKVNLTIKNSGGGEEAATNYGITNGEGLTVKDMQAGETYQVLVKQYSGLDSYTLSIGNQKETLDITGHTIVKDSVEFRDQRNVYLFTPPITGRYRFEISDLTKGSNHKVNLLVFNSGGGEEASTEYGIANGEGLTVKGMQAGETYQVQVRQYSGYDSYHLNVGYQKDAIDISEYNVITDSVQYRDQRNVYYYTSAVTGRYRFEISNLTKGSSNKVNLLVWNERGGEEDSTSYGIKNGEGLTITDMQANETYEIQVHQYSGYDLYNLNIGLQKETRDISKYISVSDSIQYTDQRNVYTLTPSSSGKYRFEIQGLADGSNNRVNILVFNSRGGEEGSTSHGIGSGKWLEISDMQADETYQIEVQYYSGYDSYKLSAVKVEE